MHDTPAEPAATPPAPERSASAPAGASDADAPPPPHHHPDGSRRTPGGGAIGIGVWVALLLVIALTIAIQWGLGPFAVAATGDDEPSPPDGLVKIMGRYAVGAQRLAGGAQPDVGKLIVEQIRLTLPSPADQLRISVVEAEVVGVDAALASIDAAIEKATSEAKEQDENASEADAESLTTPDWVLTDLRALRRLYTQDNGDALPDESRQALLDHHGWFAELALSHGLDDDDPARRPLIAAAVRFVLVAFSLLSVAALAMFTGFILLILASVRAGARRLLLSSAAVIAGVAALVVGGLLQWQSLPLAASAVSLLGVATATLGIAWAAIGGVKTRFVAPTPGGSAYLEAFLIFLVGFLVVSFGAAFINDQTGFDPTIGLIWLLLLPALWPLVRGVSMGSLRNDLGWRRGEGVFKEIGAGLLGYCAGLPIFALGVVMTLLLSTMLNQLQGGSPSSPPTHPIINEAGSGGLWGALRLYLLASVWAPIVEESLFRGALFHHFRGRAAPLVAAFGSALIFGSIHPQGIVAIPALLSLGFVFAMIREWRGSIIGCMTAHSLHNGALMTMLIIGLS